MKKNLFICLLVLTLYFFTNSAMAQSMQFSQYYSAPLVLAPSFAGLTQNSRISMNYRDQWPNIPGVFRTYGVSLDTYVPKYNSGFGLMVLRDVAGTGNLGLTDVSLHYAYNIKLSRDWQFRPGIAFRYDIRSIDYYKLLFGDQMDPNFVQNQSSSIESQNFGSGKVGYIDFTTSALAYSDIIWGGFTVDHLLRPNQSLLNEESKTPLALSVFGGIRFYQEKSRFMRRKNDASISLSFLYKNTMGYDQLDLGLYWRRRGLTVGSWYRGMPLFLKQVQKSYSNIDAIIFVLGYKLEIDQYRKLNIGYSYDFTVSKLINHTGGAHEVSLSYEFDSRIRWKGTKHKQVPCPMF